MEPDKHVPIEMHIMFSHHPDYVNDDTTVQMIDLCSLKDVCMGVTLI